MSHPEIQVSSPEGTALGPGTRLVARLGGELVAIVPLSDLRKLEASEYEPSEPERRWESEGGPALGLTRVSQDPESLRSLVERLLSLGIDPASVAIPSGTAIHAELGGEVRLEVAEPARRAAPDFSREDD